MEYSFKTFMEENYMDRLVSAAESFFAHDETCTMDVSVRYVMLDDTFLGNKELILEYVRHMIKEIMLYKGK